MAERGHLLLSADYSQIELRILAHLSKDATLDRHLPARERTCTTARRREIFGALSPVAPEEQRRVSKMVNYALLYGKTAFTLAKDIGRHRKRGASRSSRPTSRATRRSATSSTTPSTARGETGSVRTLLGRLRRLPDLSARNSQVRTEAERQAMNTAVQGSAADLIKKAMIDLHRDAAPQRAWARG